MITTLYHVMSNQEPFALLFTILFTGILVALHFCSDTRATTSQFNDSRDNISASRVIF